MKLLKTTMLSGLFLLLFSACKNKDADSGNAYPKNLSITYRVSSIATNKLVSITYDNESGGLTTINDPVLPFTKTITKTINRYNIISLGYFVNPAQNVKLEILVNNVVVKSQEFTSANSSISYTFL